MYSYVSDCNNFYNYGNINPNVFSCVFEYNYSIVNFNSLVEFMANKYSGHRVYLFMAKNYYYPIPFWVKCFGLWKTTEKEEIINLLNFDEKSESFKEHFCAYGLAEIPHNQLHRAIELLFKNSFSAFLVFSKDDMFVNTKYTDFLNKTDSGFEISFSNLINTQTQENVIITCLKGYDSITMNVFSCKKQTGEL